MYELAFLAGEYLAEHLTRGVELVLLTAEEQPLVLFGSRASSAITKLLELRGIRVEPNAPARGWAEGTLSLADGRELDLDAAVALPAFDGPSLEGIPQDGSGFVATDEFGAVLGLTDVYAAGDLTQSPVKQGGLATQQADTAASAIAADAGAPVRPTPYEPVLRGLLLTGLAPRFLRSDDLSSVVDTQPLWWPPAKIVGRHLSPFLAEHLGLATTSPQPPTDAVPVEVTLDTRDHATWSSV